MITPVFGGDRNEEKKGGGKNAQHKNQKLFITYT